ncbi:MAG TPA: isocitrate dehydrogenase [bacterium]|nr:isocitrate dehydrogenase [bacterium]
MSMFELVGADVFLQHEGLPAAPELVGPFRLEGISNRGTRIWPGELPDILLVDCHRCRYVAEGVVPDAGVLELLGALEARGFRWVHVEKLHRVDGRAGYSGVE